MSALRACADHAAQLLTIDLATGEHRFHLPRSLCNISERYSNFNAGRLKQWRAPSVELRSSWASSKWAGRDWRPLVSMRLEWLSEPLPNSSCSRLTSWASAFEDGMRFTSTDQNEPAAVRHLRHEIREEAVRLLGSNGSSEWANELSVQLDASEPLEPRFPNVFIYFPTYHGQRQHFNGCERPLPSRRRDVLSVALVFQIARTNQAAAAHCASRSAPCRPAQASGCASLWSRGPRSSPLRSTSLVSSELER